MHSVPCRVRTATLALSKAWHRVSGRPFPVAVAHLCSGASNPLKHSGQQRQFRTDASKLREIPGVGPKTALLLRDKGIASMEQLNDKLRQADISLSDASEIADFLRTRVGVRHRRHAHQIAEYVMENMPSADGPPVTVAIEGNISVGKSTLIRHMQASDTPMSNMTEFVLEPVERWQDVRGHNILEAFYENPERYAYTFQSFVFLTRLLDGGLSPSALPQRVLERSVFSDSMVFLRAIHNAQWLSEMEFELLTTYFSPLCRKFPQIVPNGFIYLRADPETCFRRLQGRNRSEETGVSLPYLEQIHQYHEQWFEPSQTLALPEDGGLARGVSIVPDVAHSQMMSSALPYAPSQGALEYGFNALGARGLAGSGLESATQCTQTLENSAKKGTVITEVPEMIRDNVVYLQGRDGFSVFEHIPTLILDCSDSTSSGLITSVSAEEQHSELFAKHAVMVQCFFDFLREEQRAAAPVAPASDSAPLTQAQTPVPAQEKEYSVEVPTMNLEAMSSLASSWPQAPDSAGRGADDKQRRAAQLLLNNLVDATR